MTAIFVKVLEVGQERVFKGQITDVVDIGQDCKCEYSMLRKTVLNVGNRCSVAQIRTTFSTTLW